MGCVCNSGYQMNRNGKGRFYGNWRRQFHKNMIGRTGFFCVDPSTTTSTTTTTTTTAEVNPTVAPSSHPTADDAIIAADDSTNEPTVAIVSSSKVVSILICTICF